MQLTWTRKSGARTAVGVAALALAAVGPTGAGGSSAAGAAPVAVVDCAAPAPAHARQMGGGDGTDPNSVSLNQTLTMESQLQAGIESLQSQASARAARSRRHHGHHHGHHHVHLPTFVRVNTYVHVITAADGTGDVTNKQIWAQMKVINDGFAGRTSETAAATPFHFRLVGIDRTANDDWYDWADPGVDPADDIEVKTALHQGSFRDLNIYIAALGDGLLGYANYPNEVALAEDGLVLLNDSLPGGAAAPYNEGDTATHEIGHWLFLMHTFENGCLAPGDEIDDTPYQADGDNIFECDEALDTCAQPGTDPVHNFMSYGDDPCLDAFTPGQALRMTYAWLVFRRAG